MPDWSNSAMVAVVPADPERFAIPGGMAPDELHVTVLYLGTTDDSEFPAFQSLILTTAETVATLLPTPLRVTVTGAAQFGVEQNGTPIVLMVESPTLLAIRDSLKAVLAREGMTNPDHSTHAYNAHLTLGYATSPDEAAAMLDQARELIGQVFICRKLHVSLGSMDHYFDLGAGTEIGAPDEQTQVEVEASDEQMGAAGEATEAFVAGSQPELGADTTESDGTGDQTAVDGGEQIVPAAACRGCGDPAIGSVMLGGTTTWFCAGCQNKVLDEHRAAMAAEETSVDSEAPEIAADEDQGDGLVPFSCLMVVEGTDSGDGRRIAPGALTWRDLPVSVMSMLRNPDGGAGHDGAQLVGHVARIEREHGGRIRGFGVIDTNMPGGKETVYAIRQGHMRGVSVDLDKVERATATAGNRSRDAITAGRVMGLTILPFQAFAEATITLDEQLVASAACDCDRPAIVGASVWTPYTQQVAGEDALIASGGPIAPPAEWFAYPGADCEDGIIITPEGRVYGRPARRGACHISFGRCVPVPRSNTGYAAFRVGRVVTAEGTIVRTGPVVMDTVHPDLRLRASDAQAFYAHTGCAIADVVAYDDDEGMVIAGALRPGVTDEQVRAAMASDVSPDWRTVNGNPRECVAMLVVNNSGFKPTEALAASAGEMWIEPGHGAALERDGEVIAMVAGGGNRDEQTDRSEATAAAGEDGEDGETAGGELSEPGETAGGELSEPGDDAEQMAARSARVETLRARWDSGRAERVGAVRARFGLEG